MTPELMPPADVNLDALPFGVEAAAFDEIYVDGYHQPAVPKSERMDSRTPKEVEAARERMRTVSKHRRERMVLGPAAVQNPAEAVEVS